MPYTLTDSDKQFVMLLRFKTLLKKYCSSGREYYEFMSFLKTSFDIETAGSLDKDVSDAVNFMQSIISTYDPMNPDERNLREMHVKSFLNTKKGGEFIAAWLDAFP